MAVDVSQTASCAVVVVRDQAPKDEAQLLWKL